jgi:stearoyl-CoA desaturase (delta-9 desaturase)
MTAELTIGVLLVGWYLSVGLGVTVGYHRTLTHRSLELPKWFLYPLVFMGLGAGPPIPWVSNHRNHHAKTDTPEDPHAPGIHGFWFAHCGWYLGIRNRLACFLYAMAGPLRLLIDAACRPVYTTDSCSNTQDLKKFPFLVFISRRPGYILGVLIHTVPFVICLAFQNYYLLAILWLTVVAMYNAGDAVNSVTHRWGGADFQTSDKSRNHFWVAMFSLGEGWHNSHHAFPSSARHGLAPGQLDFSWLFIQLLRRLKIASAVRQPNPKELNGRRSSGISNQ